MRKNIIFLLFLLTSKTLFAQSEAVYFKEKKHNFGTIKEEGGIVTHIFEFQNKGDIPVMISTVQASCGCTTPIWSKKPVLPFETGMVKVSYTPNNRPGKFTKTINVTTNLGTYQLLVHGIVMPRPKSLVELYPKKMEQLRLTTSYVMFNEIGNKQQKTIFIEAVNDSKETIEIDFGKTPKYITMKMLGAKLTPKEKGSIEILYDASKASFWGFNSDLVPLLINGVEKISNSLVVTATRIEDFSKLSKQELQRAPILGVDQFEKQFSATMAGDKVRIEFKITNIGKRPLILRKIDSSSESLKVSISNTVIQPNNQEILGAIFDTMGKKGYQNQQITVVTNAPDLPIVNFRISGIVE